MTSKWTTWMLVFSIWASSIGLALNWASSQTQKILRNNFEHVSLLRKWKDDDSKLCKMRLESRERDTHDCNMRLDYSRKLLKEGK